MVSSESTILGVMGIRFAALSKSKRFASKCMWFWLRCLVVMRY
jgi:hypothetical protein